MKKETHALGLECIVDRDGDVCIRPMHFDGDGVRQVRLHPDPCEFGRPEVAEAKLRTAREAAGGGMNPAAQALGRLARGVPKRFTPEELELRRARLAEARKARWRLALQKRPDWDSVSGVDLATDDLLRQRYQREVAQPEADRIRRSMARRKRAATATAA